nr:hypothetical protein [Mangrovicoccus ximenensis]
MAKASGRGITTPSAIVFCGTGTKRRQPRTAASAPPVTAKARPRWRRSAGEVKSHQMPFSTGSTSIRNSAQTASITPMKKNRVATSPTIATMMKKR